MRNGFLGSISILLASVGWAMAQTPTARPYEDEIVQTATPAVAAGTPVVGERRSPYWPNPAGLDPAACAPGTCPTGDCAKPGCKDKCEYEDFFWIGAEYLLWWTKDGPLPVPLLTTSPPGSLGIIGNPGTAFVGNSDFDYKAASGGRLTLGFWIDKTAQHLALEGVGFFLERRPASFDAFSSATGTPLYARPFINAVGGGEDALLVSGPGQFAGLLTVGSHSRFYGWEANLVRPSIVEESDMRFDFLFGIRYVHLDEDVTALQHSALLPGGSAGFGGQIINPPGTITVFDRFQTRNEFYGGQFGVRGETRMGRMVVNGRAKVAFGNSHQILNVDGASRLSQTNTGPFTNPGSPQSTVPGGMLAVSSNIGRTARDEFAVVPELGFNVGYQLRPCATLFAGYTWMYWSNLVRPGEQIDRVINPTIVPSSQAFGLPVGPAQPLPRNESSSYWAQGLNFGLELRY